MTQPQGGATGTSTAGIRRPGAEVPSDWKKDLYQRSQGRLRWLLKTPAGAEAMEEHRDACLDDWDDLGGFPRQ
jgi:hypothetical protein